MIRSISFVAIALTGACADPTSDTTTSSTAQAVSQNVTRIKIRGEFAETFLNDPAGFNGGLTASRDLVANTTSLDFNYASVSPTDPNVVILITGAGAIPNNTFSISSSAAHLAVTTPFSGQRCEINTSTGDSTCTDNGPSTFDVTWAKNGFEIDIDNNHSKQILGPVTTITHGKFTRVSADTNGTFDGHTTQTPSQGFLEDTKSLTVTRDVSGP